MNVANVPLFFFFLNSWLVVYSGMIGITLQVFVVSDLPGGVVNIITCERDYLAKYLSEHHDVQAAWCHGGSATTLQLVELASADKVKHIWVDYGLHQKGGWTDNVQGAGEEFLCHSTQVKNVWIPMGDIIAN